MTAASDQEEAEAATRPIEAPETESEALARLSWDGNRKRVLSEHGLWSAWKDVPPPGERDGPLSEYLPDGYE